MAKKGINELIEELEDYVEGCKQQKFSSNKVIVSKDQILNMIREIKVKIPSEVEQCARIMKNKEEIIEEARKRADDIMNSARDDAQRRVNESEIMQTAAHQAEELLIQAKEQADQMINQASEDGDIIRMGALRYTNNMMKDLSEFTQHYIEEEKSKFDALVQKLNTIEANRAQITSQLDRAEASEETEDGDGSGKKASEVERIHSQETRSNRAGFKVPEVGSEVPQKENRGKKTSESDLGQNESKEPIEDRDELDELDELYLDEFQ